MRKFFGALLSGRVGWYVCRLRWERYRDNMRFLVIGRAVWEPPQAREWAPGYVLCVRVHGLSGQDGPRVRVPGTA